MSMRRTLTLACAATFTASLAACKAEREAPKTPIGSAAGSAARDRMPTAARAALDSGNVLLRGGDAKGAIAQYTLAANADPGNAAPWYGVMMAAQRAGDQRLADSAAAMVRKTSGNPQLTDSGMAKMHAEGGAGLPPGHPSAGMPQGHPPIGGAPSAAKTPAPKKTT